MLNTNLVTTVWVLTRVYPIWVTRQINLALATFVPRKAISGFGLFDVSKTKIRVGLGDLDIYMHVNNAVYLNMMDSARSNMIADMNGMKKLNELGWYPVVAASSVTYKSSLLFGQRAVVETQIIGWDKRICYLSQVIKRDNKVVTQAWVAARFLSRKNEKNPSPADVMSALNYTEASPNLPPELKAWADAVGVLFRERAPGKLSE